MKIMCDGEQVAKLESKAGKNILTYTCLPNTGFVFSSARFALDVVYDWAKRSGRSGDLYLEPDIDVGAVIRRRMDNCMDNLVNAPNERASDWQSGYYFAMKDLLQSLRLA